MTKRFSFSKYENAALPNFRQKINHAESAEDLKKFFAYTAKELVENILADPKINIEYGDVSFMPDGEPHYMVSDRLLNFKEFITVWNDSDLPHVIARLAKPAMNRYKHLKKHPEKTEAKIRM